MTNGLEHLNTTATTAASVSIDNVFSATYRNYLVIIEGSGSTQLALRGRLRTGGSSASGSDYIFQYSSLENTTNVRTRATLDGFDFGVLTSSTTNLSVSNIFSPALASPTRLEGRFYDTRVVEGLYVTQHTLSTAYDGLEVYVASGTLNVSISIYGYAIS